MRWLVLVALVSLTAAPVAAQHLGPKELPVPPKAEPQVAPNVPGTRQGGDTIADAVPIDLDSGPVSLNGTTSGYTDDYDEVCPYTGSTSPDVVYALSSSWDTVIDIDMCGSSYDTKIYVYDEALNLVACNDDFYVDDICGMYVSRIEALPVLADMTYSLVIDGYGGDHGDYVLEIYQWLGDYVTCPDGPHIDEGEPPLANDHLDSYNGGCNSPQFGDPFQPILGDEYGEAIFCGQAGWYTYQGSDYRDTDWFWVMVGSGGTIEVEADANNPTLVYELFPQDCASVAVAQQIEVGPFMPQTMTIAGYDPGQMVWLWAGSSDFTPPGGNPPQEYLYVLWISGLEAAVATEPTSWGAVKALYR